MSQIIGVVASDNVEHVNMTTARAFSILATPRQQYLYTLPYMEIYAASNQSLHELVSSVSKVKTRR